jgi:hypothetical protein
MADVQLAGGYTRIAHSLHRAIIVARFTHLQMRIVSLLIDRSFGWNRLTVEISQSEIAGMLDLVNAHAGFRRGLGELIHEGVVIEVRRGGGQEKAVYAIQKNFERWGKFSVASAMLVARFGGRPGHADTLFRLGIEHDQPSAEDQEEPPPPPAKTSPPKDSVSAKQNDDSEGAPGRAGCPSEGTLPLEGQGETGCPSEGMPLPGPSGRPHRGTLTGSKSFDDEILQRPKDMQDSSTNYYDDNIAHAHTRETTPESSPADGDTDDFAPFDFTLEELPVGEILSGLLETDHQRAHVCGFLARCPDGDRIGWPGRLAMWLQGHDCPPTLIPTPAVLSTAVSEYKGDFMPRHVWAFVADVVERYKAAEAKAAGSGERLLSTKRLGFPARASPGSKARAMAQAAWDVIKRDGLATCNPNLIPIRVHDAAIRGELPALLGGADAFLALVRRLPRATLSAAKTDWFAVNAILEVIEPNAG